MNAIEGVKQEFTKIVSDAFGAVLSQTSGSAWESSQTQAPPDPATFSTCFTLSGAIEGAVIVACAFTSGRLIARTLLGESEGQRTGSELEADEVEALQEFFRQVMGLAESAAGSTFGPVEIKASADRQEAYSAGQVAIGARCGDQELAIVLGVRELRSPNVQEVELATGSRHSDNLNLLMNVTLPVVMRFGQRQMRLREILELGSGAVVELNRRESEPVELLLDDKLIARGEVVIVEGNYGFRVLEVATPQVRLEAVPK